jgi:hypothetical protein
MLARQGRPGGRRILDIPLGASINIVRRLLKFDGKPVVLDEIYLPGDVFQGLTLEILQNNQDSLYTLFETRFGVRMIRAEERIRAVAADRASPNCCRSMRAARCCRWNASLTPTATSRSSGAAACIPRRALLPERVELIPPAGREDGIPEAIILVLSGYRGALCCAAQRREKKMSE